MDNSRSSLVSHSLAIELTTPRASSPLIMRPYPSPRPLGIGQQFTCSPNIQRLNMGRIKMSSNFAKPLSFLVILRNRLFTRPLAERRSISVISIAIMRSLTMRARIISRPIRSKAARTERRQRTLSNIAIALSLALLNITHRRSRRFDNRFEQYRL